MVVITFWMGHRCVCVCACMSIFSSTFGLLFVFKVWGKPIFLISYTFGTFLMWTCLLSLKTLLHTHTSTPKIIRKPIYTPHILCYTLYWHYIVTMHSRLYLYFWGLIFSITLSYYSFPFFFFFLLYPGYGIFTRQGNPSWLLEHQYRNFPVSSLYFHVSRKQTDKVILMNPLSHIALVKTAVCM